MSIRSLERMLKERDQEICRCHQETIRVHNYWFEVFEDMQKEHLREIKKLQAEKKALEQRALKAERECDELYDKKKELLHKLYDVLTQLEDEKGKHQKLTAQINRDYENSSIPSSKAVQRKKITNSREKQAGNQADSQDIKATAAGNRSPHSQSFFFRHRKKSWKTVLLKRPQKPL